jgi:hypothetical protein
VKSTGSSVACIEVKTTGAVLSIGLLFMVVGGCFALPFRCEYTNKVLVTLKIDTKNAIKKSFVFMIINFNYFSFYLIISILQPLGQIECQISFINNKLTID